ncbi:MAG TPA: Vms1/Ankzf1 family peptidyl-tRNA hydrolase [Longimicrobium sp.]|nr:Vms1/Ankzf1 family peptidyl-tRNA hydrolase [Longimicrobium sp.]
MITKQDLERLINREESGRPVVSLFLDMSVNQNNKRTHQIFLSQKRAQFGELQSEWMTEHEEGVESLWDRVQGWLNDGYEEANAGVVIYAEVGGEWFEALQTRAPLQNRLIVAPRPVVAPLAQVLEGYRHYGVVLTDREHVRLLSVYQGTVLDQVERRGDPLPPPHDVQAGGYAQSRYQRRKMEETKHFFRDFAAEVQEFVRRYDPDDIVLLGTEENLSFFAEQLPDSILQRVVYTGPMWVDENAAEVIRQLEPLLQAELDRTHHEVVEQVRDRVVHDYMATAGFQGTLSALQEGRVDTLVLARDQRRDGVRCAQCGFVFARELNSCPYDGSTALTEVDVVEEMVRMAEGQGVTVAYADPGEVADMKGAGALLRY